MIYFIKKFSENNKYNIDNFENIIKDLNLDGGKAPRGMKPIYESLVRIKNLYNSIKEWGNNEMLRQQLSQEIDRYTDKEWNLLLDKLRVFSQQVKELNLKNAIYINNSIIAERRFIQLANDLDKFLSTLTGIHRKALEVGDKLIIYFVKASVMKSKGKYVSRENAFKIRPDRVDFQQQGYASFTYILVHELGHRYLDYFKNTPDFNSPQWYTTPYSKKDSWNEEEVFAELFALSFWKKDYPQYQSQIDKFLKLLT